jgi:hypothetical protein
MVYLFKDSFIESNNLKTGYIGIQTVQINESIKRNIGRAFLKSSCSKMNIVTLGLVIYSPYPFSKPFPSDVNERLGATDILKHGLNHPEKQSSHDGSRINNTHSQH